MAGSRITCCTPLPWRLILVRQSLLSCSEKKKKKEFPSGEYLFVALQNPSFFFSLSKVSGKNVGGSFVTPRTEVVKALCPENKFSVKPVHYTWLLE